jgi:hypothetical protein
LLNNHHTIAFLFFIFYMYIHTLVSAMLRFTSSSSFCALWSMPPLFLY